MCWHSKIYPDSTSGAGWGAPVSIKLDRSHILQSFFKFTKFGFRVRVIHCNWDDDILTDLPICWRCDAFAGGVACALDEDKGFDLGVFIPLLLAFPDANIPTFQVSLCSTLSPQTHVQIGKLFQPLRDQSVLIICSGMSYHDVGALMGIKEVVGSDTFDNWLSNSMLKPSAKREEALLKWAAAPSARLCHPREEHLLPIHVIAGAATGGKGMIGFIDTVLGVTISAYQFQ